MRILIVAPAWIGDAVMAQPLFSRLKELHPSCSIDVLAPAWVLPVFSRMEEIAHSMESPFGHGQLALKKRFALGKTLRNRYDCAYVLPNSFKSALIPFFARIAHRIGFVGEMRYGLLNSIHALNKKQLPKMVQRFLRLADDPQTPIQLKPFVYPHLKAENPAAILAKHHLNLQKKVIVFCPGAEFGAAKRWPAQHFATLAQKVEQEGWQVWLMGSSKDWTIGQTIAAASGAVNLCGQTSLLEAIDLIARARAVVCNDSGLMHIASALNRPLVALYGSSSPEFTPPLNHQAEIVRLNLECSPCFQRECPLKHLDCLEKIEPQRIFQILENVLCHSTLNTKIFSKSSTPK